jgi:hypothetical protein
MKNVYRVKKSHIKLINDILSSKELARAFSEGYAFVQDTKTNDIHMLYEQRGKHTSTLCTRLSNVIIDNE